MKRCSAHYSFLDYHSSFSGRSNHNDNIFSFGVINKFYNTLFLGSLDISISNCSEFSNQFFPLGVYVKSS